jgi:exopolysaccharide biosynthesis polyprenyl glycosylphosphotransferase
MTSFRRRLLLSAFKSFDLAVMVASFVLAALPVSYMSGGMSFASFLSMRVKVQNAFLFLLLLFLWHVVFAAFGLYRSKRFESRKDEVGDVLKATLSGTIAIVVAAACLHIQMVTPLFIGLFLVFSSVLTIASRLLLRSVLNLVRQHGRNLREVVIVGTNSRALALARTIESRPELGYHLLGFADQDWHGIDTFRMSGYRLIGDLAGFPRLLREHVIDEVVLALPMKSLYPQASRVAAHCQEQGIIVRQVAQLFETGSGRSSGDEMDHEGVVTIYSSSIESWPMLVKRVIDIIGSIAALSLLAPVFLVTATLIALDSPGPVFFSQYRMGLNKRRFRMYKFRTMAAGAEKKQLELESLNESDGPVFKIKNDPRITRVGKFLRKFSIDELPQFFNVLRGDMSLVGPRPLPVRDYQGFEQDWHRRRFSIRPGLTCLWQINGRSTVSFSHWMDLDLRYIDHWSLWLDFKILAKTVPAVLRGLGAV